MACGITASDKVKSVTKSAVFVALSILNNNMRTSVIGGLLAEPTKESPRNKIRTILFSPTANWLDVTVNIPLATAAELACALVEVASVNNGKLAATCDADVISSSLIYRMPVVSPSISELYQRKATGIRKNLLPVGVCGVTSKPE